MKNLGYSQNFLVNKKLVERLISKSNIDVTDYVIEIGPGKGIITDVLSQHAGEVVAVEYDQELYNNLVRYHSHDNVTYIFGDFLKYKLPLNRRYKILFIGIPIFIRRSIHTMIPSRAPSFPTAADGTKIAFVLIGSFPIHFQNNTIVFSFKPLEVKNRVLINLVLF